MDKGEVLIIVGIAAIVAIIAVAFVITHVDVVRSLFDLQLGALA